MAKGSQMAISGRIQTRSYDAKDGTKRYVTEVVATEIQFLDKAKGNKEQVSMPADAFSGGDFEDDITPVEDSSMPF